MTSRSRGVSDSYRASSAANSVCSRRASRSRSVACSMASSRSWSRKGLLRNSTAPAFMACTVIAISPCPVMKIIGISIFRSLNSRWRFRPLSPGSRTSRTKHLGKSGRSASKNSSPDANVSEVRPTAPSSCAIAVRTDRSSSITMTICSACFILPPKAETASCKFHDNQRDVVILRRVTLPFQYFPHNVFGRLTRAERSNLKHYRSQSLFAELDAIRTQGFSHTIGVNNDRVSTRQGKRFLLIWLIKECTDDWPTGRQQFDRWSSRASDYRRVVAGVDVRELTCRSIEFCKKESGVTSFVC